jgi:hypothetical protein
VRIRKARPLVRIHHAKMEASLEGFLVGRWHGHYVLRVAKLIGAEDSSFSFEGPEVRVPAENVLFIEVLR